MLAHFVPNSQSSFLQVSQLSKKESVANLEKEFADIVGQMCEVVAERACSTSLAYARPEELTRSV
jgi:hypothetical protein